MRFRVDAKAAIRLWTDVEAGSQNETKRKAKGQFCIQPVEEFVDADPEDEWAAE